jgi:hypothetical protein
MVFNNGFKESQRDSNLESENVGSILGSIRMLPFHPYFSNICRVLESFVKKLPYFSRYLTNCSAAYPGRVEI